MRQRLKQLLAQLSWVIRPGSGLGQKTANAGVWAFALSINNRLLHTIRTIFIARLLAPEDLGLMGIALLMVSFLLAFTQTGFRAALIQRKEDITDHLDTAWTIELIRNAALAAILALGAPSIAAFFEAPQAVGVIRVMALAIFLPSLENIAVVEFDKELEFQRRFVYRSIPAVVDLVVSISFAILLQSVWALVFGVMARNLVRVIASYVVHPYRPRLSIDRSKALSMYRFGVWLVASNILVYTILHLDDVVVGRVAGVAALGFYQLAFTMSQIVTTELTLIINQVVFPAYSKIQDSTERLRKAYLRTLQLVTLIGFPMAAGLWFVSGEMIEVILGEKWMPMLSAFNVLLMWGLIRSVLATTGPLFEGVGRPSIATRVQMLQVAILAAVIFPFTTRWGIVGAAWATVVAAVLPSTIAVAAAVRIVGARRDSVMKLIGYPMLTTAVMFSVLTAIRASLPFESPVVLLLWAVPTGVLLYVSGVWVLRKLVGYTADGIILSRDARR